MFRLFCCFDVGIPDDPEENVPPFQRHSTRSTRFQGSFAPQDQTIYDAPTTPNLFHFFEEDLQFKDTISNPIGTRGLRTRHDVPEIPAETYIGDYTGTILRQQQKDARIANGQGGYIIELGFNDQEQNVYLWVDAREDDNNILRLINNNCNDSKVNIYYRKEMINSTNNTGGIACIRAYTSKAIPPGTQVFINFNHQLMHQVVPIQHRIQCFCQGFHGEGQNRYPRCPTYMT
jgi:hypothetical protein